MGKSHRAASSVSFIFFAPTDLFKISFPCFPVNFVQIPIKGKSVFDVKVKSGDARKGFDSPVGFNFGFRDGPASQSVRVGGFKFKKSSLKGWMKEKMSV